MNRRTFLSATVLAMTGLTSIVIALCANAADTAAAMKKAEETKPQVFHLDLAFAKYRPDYLRRLIPQLKKCGFNTILWEMEDAVRFDTCPEIAAPDAMSKAELAAILAFARESGLENMPLLQTLSHNAYVLRHPKYQHLSERPGFLELYCLSRPETGRFLTDWAMEIADLFGNPRYFHIGADEANKIGKECDLCRKSVEELGVAGLIVKHLSPVEQALFERRITPVMWADMVHNHAGLKTMLDRRIILADWWYEPAEQAFRRVSPDKRRVNVFAEAAELRKSGFAVWGCGASRCYGDSVFAPRHDHHFKNHREWRRAFAEIPLEGVMLTSWSWHLFPLELQMPVIALAAYDGLGDAQYEEAFARDWLGVDGKEFFRAVRLLSPPVLFSMTAKIGHNQVNHVAAPDAVIKEAQKLSAKKENRARESEKAAALLAGYQDAARALRKLEAQAGGDREMLRDWILAADNLVFRARLQLFLLASEPDEVQRQALSAALDGLRQRSEAMYLKKVGPACTALLTGNIFGPAEHALRNWRGPSATGVK